jgi:hypothetical protein
MGGLNPAHLQMHQAEETLQFLTANAQFREERFIAFRILGEFEIYAECVWKRMGYFRQG